MNDMQTPAAVYVQTNETGENRIVTFDRAPDGSLSELGSYATGGAGNGIPHLTSQGSLALTSDRRHLLVTNAGSGDVSLFALASSAPSLVQTVETGPAPKSVAEHDGLVYVLNTGGPTIAGFRLVDGRLEPLADSRARSGSRLRSRADRLHARRLDARRHRARHERDRVLSRGRVGPPRRGAGPAVVRADAVRLRVHRGGTLVVTEAFGAQVGRAAASSYVVRDGSVTPVSRSIGNGRSEICWAVVTDDGRYAFTTNFADGAVSRYAVADDGTLTLEDAAAGIAVDGRTGLRDEDLTNDGRFLYAVDADSRRVFGWAVERDGTLSPVGSWNGLPATAAGLAAS